MRGLETISGIGGWHWRVATPPLLWVWLFYDYCWRHSFLFSDACAGQPWRRPCDATTFWWNPFPMLRIAPQQLEVYLLMWARVNRRC